MKILKRLSIFLSFALSLGLFSTVQAQAVRNTAERVQDRNQIEKDKATIQRDRAEIIQFRAYKEGLAKAIRDNNPGAARGHHTKLVVAMEREVQQSKAKTAQANREIGQSNREVRSDNREIRSNRGKNRPLRAADDRRDRRDDVRDRNDDRQDRNEVKMRSNRQAEILAAFRSIQTGNNPNSLQALQAKKNLLDEFEQTMIRDMGENWEELGEDKRELQEDRRETREDRRQR